MNAPDPMPGAEAPRAAPWWSVRRSVFWKVAGVLVGVQMAVAALAVGLSARFAYDRSLELAAGSLRLRLDGLGEEVEQRAGPALDSLALRPAGSAAGPLPLPLRLDLSARFPDPVTLLSPEGQPLSTFAPDTAEAGAVAPALPPNLAEALQAGAVVVQLDGRGRDASSYGLAPLYTPDGLLAGGLLVQPLRRSLARELAGTRRAFLRALLWTAGLAGLAALALGAFFTRRLVRPLRRITRGVERIGAGEYATRLPTRAEDEFGRLATATNQMAAAVEESIKRLRATDRLRRELVANIGHDLRTPLAVLLGHAEEAARFLQKGKAEAAKAALGSAARQGRYLHRLVDDLFELSLLTGPAVPLRREPVPLGQLLADAARAHRPALTRAGLAFETDLPPALPVLQADGARLLRALHNLLDNARQHAGTGATVHLRARVEADEVRIVVEDDGAGMPEAALARVFERYYRGEDARTRPAPGASATKAPGTGLGLPISRAVAEAHGGRLTAESAPGRGSRFVLRLPLL